MRLERGAQLLKFVDDFNPITICSENSAWLMEFLAYTQQKSFEKSVLRALLLFLEAQTLVNQRLQVVRRIASPVVGTAKCTELMLVGCSSSVDEMGSFKTGTPVL